MWWWRPGDRLKLSPLPSYFSLRMRRFLAYQLKEYRDLMWTYLMSFKPVFALQILRGIKAFEIRRRFPAKEGSLLVVYASRPISAVLGDFAAGRIRRVRAEVARKNILEGAYEGCDSRDLEYVGEGGYVYVAEVTRPNRYPFPISLDEIRKIIPRFTPPRSYIRLAGRYSPLLERILELRRKALTYRRALIFGTGDCPYCKEAEVVLGRLLGRENVSLVHVDRVREGFKAFRYIYSEIMKSPRRVPLTVILGERGALAVVEGSRSPEGWMGILSSLSPDGGGLVYGSAGSARRLSPAEQELIAGALEKLQA